MPANTLNFGTIREARIAEWQQSFIEIPAFDYSNLIWAGNSQVIAQFNYSATKNFTIRTLPTKPAGVNFCPVIRYRVGNTTYRYKLWYDVGEGIHEPPYRGEIIKKNFVIEIWDTVSTGRVSNASTITIPLSIRKIPVTYADVFTNYEEATENLISPSQLIQTGAAPSSPAATGLQFWFKADTGVTDAGGGAVSNWADQSGNGRDLVQAVGAQRPVITTGPMGALASTAIIALDATNHNMSWSGSAFNLAGLFIVMSMDAWTLNNIIFDTSSGSLVIKQSAVTPQIRIFGTGPFVTVVGIIGGTGQNLFTFIDSNNYLGAGSFIYATLDEFYASLIRSNSGAIEAVGSNTSITIGNNGLAAAVNFAEIIGYSTMSAATELQTLQYLAQRYRPGGFVLPIQFNTGIAWLDNT